MLTMNLDNKSMVSVSRVQMIQNYRDLVRSL